MTDRERNFSDAARVIDESVVMSLARVCVTSVERVQARLMATLKGSPHRTRSAVVVAVGCVTHALLLQLMPDRIAPVKPMAYEMVLAFGAFAFVAGFITTRSNATATADKSAGTANT